MLIQIQETDQTPVYKQVIDQVREQIAFGRLKPGEKLPSVRELARFLEINVNTVQKSYQGLKSLGLITVRPARGAIVSPQAPQLLGGLENENLLRQALAKVLREAHRLGFDREQVMTMLGEIPSQPLEDV